MQVGDPIVITENVIVIGSFGSELLTKGTGGIVSMIEGAHAEINTKFDCYTVPLASICIVDKAAA